MTHPVYLFTEPSYAYTAPAYRVTSPDGQTLTIVGIKLFSYLFGLNAQSMRYVAAGRAKQHLGWTVEKVEMADRAFAPLTAHPFLKARFQALVHNSLYTGVLQRLGA